jgi:hypothetical protein
MADLPARQPTPELLQRCREDAQQLWHHLRSTDGAAATMAAGRLLVLPEFHGTTAVDLLADLAHLRLWHALMAVAREQGHDSWPALRAACEATVLGPTAMYVQAMSAFQNQWFADYDEARQVRLHEGGYLLPYRHYFFIAERDAVAELGLDPDDPDWERIGFDWIHPRDEAAHARLRARRRKAMPPG